VCEISPDISEALISLPMDVYALVRMFAVYDPAKMGRGPPACRSARYARNQNIIFEGGWAHSNFYVDFLRRVFSVEPVSEIHSKDWQVVAFEEAFDFFGPPRAIRFMPLPFGPT